MQQFMSILSKFRCDHSQTRGLTYWCGTYYCGGYAEVISVCDLPMHAHRRWEEVSNNAHHIKGQVLKSFFEELLPPCPHRDSSWYEHVSLWPTLSVLIKLSTNFELYFWASVWKWQYYLFQAEFDMSTMTPTANLTSETIDWCKLIGSKATKVRGRYNFHWNLRFTFYALYPSEFYNMMLIKL